MTRLILQQFYPIFNHIDFTKIDKGKTHPSSRYKAIRLLDLNTWNVEETSFEKFDICDIMHAPDIQTKATSYLYRIVLYFPDFYVYFSMY